MVKENMTREDEVRLALGLPEYLYLEICNYMYMINGVLLFRMNRSSKQIDWKNFDGEWRKQSNPLLINPIQKFYD